MTSAEIPPTNVARNKFHLEKIASIECYYYCEDSTHPTFGDISGALSELFTQIKNLNSSEFEYLIDAFSDIFGEKPEDPDDLKEHYSSAKARVAFNVANSNETLIHIGFVFDIENGSLDLQNPEIEIKDGLEPEILGLVEGIKKQLGIDGQ